MRKLLALLSVAVLVPLVACVEDPAPEAPAAEETPAAETPAAEAELPILPLDQVQASQSGSVSQTVANTEITVTYDRPVARGRELYGGIVAYGQIWNPGANDATAVAFSRPVTINDQPLEAGKYSIWAIPDPDEWTLIFSRAADVFHQPYPGEEHDALRLNVAPTSGDHMETLAFYFSVVERKDAELRLHWGTTIVPLSITVP